MNILKFGNVDWNLVAQRFQYLLHLLKIFFINTLGSNINLREYYEHGDLHGERDTNMLLGHLLNTHVCSNDDEAVVWELRSKAVHGRLQILLVATHI